MITIIVVSTVFWYTSPLSAGVAFVVLILSMVYFGFFSRSALIKRKIRRTDQTRIKDVVNGTTVKIIGEVVLAGKTVPAGLSGRECAYYQIEVQQRIRGNNNAWRTLVRENGRGDLVVRDGDHYALIRDENAQYAIFQDIEYSSGRWDDPLPEMLAFLKKHGISHEGVAGLNKTMRYYEGVLEQGELCAVYGIGVWQPASKLNLNLPVKNVLVIQSMDNVKVCVSDDPDAFKNSAFPEI